MAVGKLGSGQVENRYSLSGAEFAAIGNPVVTTASECFGQHLSGGVFGYVVRPGNRLRKRPVDISPYEFFSLSRFGFFAEGDDSLPCLICGAIHNRQVSQHHKLSDRDV